MSNTETNVQNLKINRLTKTQYENQSTIGLNELSLVDMEFDGNKALVTNVNGDIVESSITNTELGYIDGVTSNIQTQLNNRVSYENTDNVEVAGVTKTVSKVSPNCIYVENGFIMGGSALSAGLVTRGVCGISNPTSTGACTKDNLYINFDGDSTWNPTERGLVLNAGNIGNNLGSDMYQHCVPRGDVVKNWVEAKLTSMEVPMNLTYADGTTATLNIVGRLS